MKEEKTKSLFDMVIKIFEDEGIDDNNMINCLSSCILSICHRNKVSFVKFNYNMDALKEFYIKSYDKKEEDK